MKKKFYYFPVVLLVIAVLAFSFIACDEDEEIERCLFNDNDKGHLHLGIGEDKCHAAAGCDLQVYGQFEDKDGNVIKIYRVGPISDFGMESVEDAAERAIEGYNISISHSEFGEQREIDFAGKVDHVYLYPVSLSTDPTFYINVGKEIRVMGFRVNRTASQMGGGVTLVAYNSEGGAAVDILSEGLQTLIKKHFGIK